MKFVLYMLYYYLLKNKILLLVKKKIKTILLSVILSLFWDSITFRSLENLICEIDLLGTYISNSDLFKWCENELWIKTIDRSYNLFKQ